MSLMSRLLAATLFSASALSLIPATASAGSSIGVYIGEAPAPYAEPVQYYDRPHYDRPYYERPRYYEAPGYRHPRWIPCAGENGLCRVPFPTRVRYGAYGHYSVIDADGPVPCNNYTFGDPARGMRKSCAFFSR